MAAAASVIKEPSIEEKELASMALSLQEHLTKLEYKEYIYKSHYLMEGARAHDLVNPMQIALNLSDLLLSDALSTAPDYYKLLLYRCFHVYLELAIFQYQDSPKKVYQSLVDKHKDAIKQLKSLLPKSSETLQTFDVALSYELDCIWECLNILSTNGSDLMTTFRAFMAFKNKNYADFAKETQTLLGRFPGKWYAQVRYIRQITDLIIRFSHYLNEKMKADPEHAEEYAHIARVLAEPSKDKRTVMITPSAGASVRTIYLANELIKQLNELQIFIDTAMEEERGKYTTKHDLHVAQAAAQAYGEIAKHGATLELRTAAFNEHRLPRMMMIDDFRGGNAPIRYFATMACVEMQVHADASIKTVADALLDKIKAGERKEHVKSLTEKWPREIWQNWRALKPVAVVGAVAAVPAAPPAAPVVPAVSESGSVPATTGASESKLTEVATVLEAIAASAAGTALRLDAEVEGIRAASVATASTVATLTSQVAGLAAVTESHALVTMRMEEMIKQLSTVVTKVVESKPVAEMMTTALASAPRVLPAPPSSYEYALLSHAIYYDDLAKGPGAKSHRAQKVLFEKGWQLKELIKVASNAYVGGIFVNERSEQVVIVHRGSQNFASFIGDYTAIINVKADSFVRSALDLLNHALVKEYLEAGFRLSTTGHGLGGWLAQLCTFWSQRYDLEETYYPEMSAVIFDSPGAVELMEAMRSHLLSEETTIDLAELNIINYCTIPNLMNTFGSHTGTLFHVPSDAGTIAFSLLASSFAESKLLEAFDLESGEIKAEQLIRITDWPKADYSQFAELSSIDGLFKDALFLPFRALMGTYQALKGAMGYRREPTWFENFIGGENLNRFRQLAKEDGIVDYRPALSELEAKLDYATKGHYSKLSSDKSSQTLSLAHFDPASKALLKRYFKQVAQFKGTSSWHKDFAKEYGLKLAEVSLFQNYQLLQYGSKRILSLTDASMASSVFAFRTAFQSMLYQHRDRELALVSFIHFLNAYQSSKQMESEKEIETLKKTIKDLSTKVGSLSGAGVSERASLLKRIERYEQELQEKQRQLDDLKEAIENLNPSTVIIPSKEEIQALLSQYYQKNCAYIERLFDTERSEKNAIDSSFINLSIVKEEEQLRKEAELKKATARSRVDAADKKHAGGGGAAGRAYAGGGAAAAAAAREAEGHEEIAETEKVETDVFGTKAKSHIRAFEEIQAVKEPIDYKDLMMKTRSEDGRHHVMVLGRPGVGKTTFLRRLCYDWTAPSPILVAGIDKATNFDYVIWLPLRAWHKANTSLYRYLKDIYFSKLNINTKIIKTLLEEKSDRVLWLIDGYDEITQAFDPKLKAELSDLLKEARHYILTSRPYYDQSISFDHKLEIIGFQDKELELYINQYFESTGVVTGSVTVSMGASESKEDKPETKPETKPAELVSLSPKATQLISFIKADTGIYTLAHTPIMLELICTAWQSSTARKASTGVAGFSMDTMSELYQEIIAGLEHHYLYDKKKEEIANIKTTLGQLAYSSFKQNQLVFEPIQAARSLGLNLNDSEFEQALKLGVLKMTGNKDSRKTYGDYYFVHLTFQEYCAAQFMAEVLIKGNTKDNPYYENVCTTLSQNKYHPRYEIALTFMAGILAGQASITPLNQFISLILSEPRDLVGIREAILMLRLLNETKLPREFAIGQNWLSKFKTMLAKVNDDKSLEILAEAIKVYPRMIKEGILDVIINKYLDRLKNSRYSFARETALKALGKVTMAGDEKVISALLGALKDSDSDVRSAALEALGVVTVVGDEKIIITLLDALKDSDSDVRSAALEALGVVTVAGDEKAISALLGALKDWRRNVRSAAREALGKVTVAGDEKVITALLGALKDSDSDVRSAVLEALGQVAVAGDEKAITALLGALKDRDWNVRSAALGALGEVTVSGDEKVISALLGALNDWDSDVKSAALEALGQVAVSGDEKVITALLGALNDSDVRSTALEALGQVTVTGDEKVITALLGALNDSNWDVRSAAVRALGQVTVSGDEKVITALLGVLNDSDWDVRSAAVRALGQITVSGDEKVITALLGALKDSVWKVRSAARVALGKITVLGDEKIITALLGALKDSVSDVRSAAVRALGQVTVGGDEKVITALLGALNDSDCDVRSAAVQALGNLVKSNFKQVLKSIVTSRKLSKFYDELLPFILAEQPSMVYLNKKLIIYLNGKKYSLFMNDLEWDNIQYGLIPAIQRAGLGSIEVLDDIRALTDKPLPDLSSFVALGDADALAKGFAEELMENIATTEGHEFVNQLAGLDTKRAQSIRLKVKAGEFKEISLPSEWKDDFLKQQTSLTNQLYEAIYAYGIEYWDDDKRALIKQHLILSVLQHLEELEEINSFKSLFLKAIRQALRSSSYDEPFMKLIQDESVKDISQFRTLLAMGADVDSYQSEKYLKKVCALQLACKHKKVALIELLLQAGASVDFRDSYGCTALQVALYTHAKEAIRDNTLIRILDLFCEHHADINAVSHSWYDGADKIASVVFSLGIAQELTSMRGNHIGWTPLHLAAYYGDSAILIRQLCDYGADIDSRIPRGVMIGWSNKTALELAHKANNNNAAAELERITKEKAASTASKAVKKVIKNPMITVDVTASFRKREDTVTKPISALKTEILSSTVSKKVEDEWYDDETIATLLQFYCKGKEIATLDALPFETENEIGANLIRDRIGDVLTEETKRCFLPLRIHGNHWIGLYIDCEPGSPLIYWIDPFGNAPEDKADIVKILNATHVFGATVLTEEHIHIQEQRLQSDGYNCGPWTVEILQFLLSNNRFPERGEIDIDEKRSEHQGIIAASRESRAVFSVYGSAAGGAGASASLGK